jgi:PAS domain S-box-containing protein
MSYVKAFSLVFFLTVLYPLKATDLRGKEDALTTSSQPPQNASTLPPDMGVTEGEYLHLSEGTSIHDASLPPTELALRSPFQLLTSPFQNRGWGFAEDQIEDMLENSKYIAALVEVVEPSKFIRASKEFCRIIGWDEKDLLTKPLANFLYPDDIKKTEKAVQKAGSHITVFNFENRYYTKDRITVRWFRWVGVPEYGYCSGQHLLLAIGDDITEEKIQEAEIQKLNEELQDKNAILQEVDKIGTIYITPEEKDFSPSEFGLYSMLDINVLEFITKTYIQLSKSDTGFLKEVFWGECQFLTGQAFHCDLAIPPWMHEISSPLEKLIKKALELREHVINNSFLSSYSCLVLPFSAGSLKISGLVVLVNAQGHDYTRELINLLAPLTNKAFHILENIKFYRWRREAEKKERHQKEKEIELHRKAQAQAEESNQVKSSFLAHMSHEIRTPLTGILGLLELIQEESMSGEDRDYLKTARTSGMSLMGILNNILDISKIESHQIGLEKINVNPIKIAQELIQLYYPEAKKQDTNLTLNITPEVPSRLIGDPVRLRQILSNLISNAVKFTKNGSVSITLAGQECPGNNAFYLRGVVTDTGIGIKLEMLSRLFQPFTQADKSIMRQFGGSGLGLYITKALCEIMGGEVKATSQVGVGSTFQFTVKMELPKKQDSAFKKYAEKSGDLKKLSDLHILIAEDNPVCWMVLKTMLDREGCSITVVENGLKAVEAAKKAPYDLILMNGEMPVMGGLEATKRIRQMFNHQTLPIIGVTAHDPDQRERFLASGMDGYLTKPVEKSRLKAEILRCLEESKSKSEKFSGLHILVAEDNLVNQLVLKTILSREGCSITVVDNGLKAVEATMRESYDLILMDGEMPVMDGLEATRKIRQVFSHQALPIIGVTAHVLDTHREQFLASGMDGYLTKPIDRNALKAEILRCLGTGGLFEGE